MRWGKRSLFFKVIRHFLFFFFHTYVVVMSDRLISDPRQICPGCFWPKTNMYQPFMVRNSFVTYFSCVWPIFVFIVVVLVVRSTITHWKSLVVEIFTTCFSVTCIVVIPQSLYKKSSIPNPRQIWPGCFWPKANIYRLFLTRNSFVTYCIFCLNYYYRIRRQYSVVITIFYLNEYDDFVSWVLVQGKIFERY